MLITKVGIYFEKLTERGRSRGQKLIAHKKKLTTICRNTTRHFKAYLTSVNANLLFVKANR